MNNIIGLWRHRPRIRTAANMTASFIFHPQRSARLIEYHSRNNSYPGLGEVIDKVISHTWKSSRRAGYPGEIQNVVESGSIAEFD